MMLPRDDVVGIENLVFEGGGVRGIAYAGALKLLEEQGRLSAIKRVAGTSAGAFTALMLSLEYSSDELRQTLQSLHFKTLEDKPNPIRIATHYGLYKGQVLMDWIEKQFTQRGLSKKMTFAELNMLGGRDLRVYATNLNLCNTQEFSVGKTPEASVAGAVRASMSIPLMYAAWQFPDSIPNDHVYVDGGTVYNYPINAFDENGHSQKTLGFRFYDKGKTEASSDLGPDNLFAYARSLFAAIMSAQTIDLEQDVEQLERTVLIDTLGYHATDLEIPDEGFEALYKAGYSAAANHFPSS